MATNFTLGCADHRLVPPLANIQASRVRRICNRHTATVQDMTGCRNAMTAAHPFSAYPSLRYAAQHDISGLADIVRCADPAAPDVYSGLYGCLSFFISLWRLTLDE
jgi:hypothetical protein